MSVALSTLIVRWSYIDIENDRTLTRPGFQFQWTKKRLSLHLSIGQDALWAWWSPLCSVNLDNNQNDYQDFKIKEEEFFLLDYWSRCFGILLDVGPTLVLAILHASAISLVRSIVISLNRFIFWRSCCCYRNGCVINSSFHVATHQNTWFGWLSNHKLPYQKLKLVCCQQSHHLT